MKYSYEDLSPGQFEALVVALCQLLLGAGAQGFATGPDGGRDAKFVGTAQLLPSTAARWEGTVIVQAKHTNGYNKTFSDADFYSDESDKTVLGEELPRIKRLRDAKELDHYILLLESAAHRQRRVEAQRSDRKRVWHPEEVDRPLWR